MASLAALLGVCPDGAWVTEDQAVTALGFGSKDDLKHKFRKGSLPHVHVDHGKRAGAAAPFKDHKFFFLQKEGTSAGHPGVSLGDWAKMCAALESAGGGSVDSSTADIVSKYCNVSDVEEAYEKLQSVNAVVSTKDLEAATPSSDSGYHFGSSGGKVPSKAAAEGEVYVRADGKKVRRVKRNNSSASNPTTLSGFLSGEKGSSKGKASGSRSVAGEGEIYIRADGKKVRRVKKSSGSSVSSEDLSSKKSLSGFLEKGGPGKSKVGGSASVAGDQIAVKKESSLTGEVYIRADGKKVRRVKKAAATADNVDIITRPDGTRVRRIKKTKATEKSKSQPNSNLSGFLDSGSSEPKTKFSGSHSVAGDQNLGGEIYVRPDGKKVRRVRKVKPKDGSKSSSSLSGFLETDATSKPKLGGSATVAGDGKESDVYVRPDGTKVRRVKRTAAKKPDSGSGEKKSLGGFLERGGGSKPKVGGSASVAGDQLAVSKNASLTGEVYIRADGKKVRRIKKSAAAPGDNVEIITRPDGTKVRRIRKGPAKPKPAETPQAAGGEGGLSSFLDAQPKAVPKGGAATVGGDRVAASEVAKKPETDSAENAETNKKSLDGFLGGMDPKPQKRGSASVAGDQLAVSKDSSLTGEVYVRADGKKVRRVKKSAATQPGDQVEIITRPDGTKVRRIKRAARKPAAAAAPAPAGAAAGASGAGGETKPKTLDGFLTSKPATVKKGGSASVSGDMLHSRDAAGEIYIRADGKKVRRIKKSAANLSDDQYEIYVRPDGKKVRRIKRSALAAKNAEAAKTDAKNPPLSSMIDKDASTAKPTGSSTVAGDDVTGKSSLKVETPAAPAPAPVPAPPPPSAPAGPATSSLSPEEEEIATQYRKMLKMGMPEGAVAQKMAVDGVAQNIVDSVVAGEVPAPAAAPAPAPPAPAPAAAAEPAARVSSLSPEEEEIATQYRKMLKMGMPEGAVAQKMAVDGVAQNIVDSVVAGEVPAPSAPAPAPAADPAVKVSTLSAEEEEIATQYRKMLKMGMPEGAVAQKMAVDGVAQNIVDSVVAGEVPSSERRESLVLVPRTQVLQPGMKQVPEDTDTSGMVLVPNDHAGKPIPEGMKLVPKDQATIPEGMVLVPKDQAERTVPDGMVAVSKDKAGEGVPDGYVLVPKDQVKGDPGDDLVLVKEDQVKKDENSTYIVMLQPDQPTPVKKEVTENKSEEDVDISDANIVSMDEISKRVEELKKGGDGKKPRFLLQALPSDRNLEEDFIKKNLLPKSEAGPPAPGPSPAPKPEKAAEPSSSIADLLAQMSTMGGDFDAEKMSEILQKLETAEKRQKKLEKQLAQAGVAIAEDIDYETCVRKVEEIAKRMAEIGGSDVTHPDKEEQNKLREEYFKLEQDMEKYNNALLLTDEYQAEQDRIEKKWEEDNEPGNIEALKKLRRHMPVEVRNMSEAQLTNEPSPNGKYLPKATAKKFKRTNVLQIIRRDPDDIVRMHPSTLENMRVTGLTLTERRALYEHLRPCGPVWKAGKAEKMTERKWTWYNMMKGNFKENLASWQRHVDQYGPPGNHPYATRANPNEGCPLIGKQCPLKADKLIDYDGDYGFPDTPEYEISDVKKADVDDAGAKAMQEALELMKEKKANERSDALKKHYKGKLLQVSKANGSCESMDEMMDKMEFGMMKWIEDIINLGDDKSKLTDDVKKKELSNFSDVLNDCKLTTLDICGRSGMQLSGKKTGDGKPDPRSIIECSLAEEVCETFDVFSKFVTDRLKFTEISDTRVKSTIGTLKELLGDLHDRNGKTTAALGGERLPRSRPLKTQQKIEDEIKEKIKNAAPPPEEEAPAGGGPALPGPPRGGLMDALKGGRGRGRGGRGGLLDALNGRGGRGGRGGGRGGLLDAINGRGRGGRGGRGGGRGGLLDAIAGRGRGGGGGDGGDGGGRGGLLAAIAGRGKGGGGGGGDGGGGGRGGLLAAIAARGGGG